MPGGSQSGAIDPPGAGVGAADGILHLVFASRRSMLHSVRTVIDFAVDALTDAAA
ncbi:MAG: hypothetical protein JWQ55_3448 [Rhodopila sp.]|nr:hypothetical protein [Rhodopila sp.]